MKLEIHRQIQECQALKSVRGHIHPRKTRSAPRSLDNKCADDGPLCANPTIVRLVCPRRLTNHAPLILMCTVFVLYRNLRIIIISQKSVDNRRRVGHIKCSLPVTPSP